jgi:hypothetical protein
VGTNDFRPQQKTIVKYTDVRKLRGKCVDSEYMLFALFHDFYGAEKVEQFVREITGHGVVPKCKRVICLVEPLIAVCS